LEAILDGSLGTKKLSKLRAKAATHELLAELRDALNEKRTPDAGLAAELLRLGANPRALEWGDNDEEEDPWSLRNIGDDGSLRTSLELLALNRHAEPTMIEHAVSRVVALNADPNRGSSREGPLVLAIRSQNIAAARALLSKGAEITRQAFVEFQRICHTGLRHEFEDVLRESFQKNEHATLQDARLWAAVQCGYQSDVSKFLEEGAQVDVQVLLALRRCRKSDVREALGEVLTFHLGTQRFRQLRAEAATLELVLELREAFRNKRDPDTDLVKELLQLGADPYTKGSRVDDSGIGTSDMDFEEENDSESDTS